MNSTAFALIALSLAVPACSSDGGNGGGSGADAEYQQKVVTGMHSALLADVNALHEAAVELQAAAPARPVVKVRRRRVAAGTPLRTQLPSTR